MIENRESVMHLQVPMLVRRCVAILLLLAVFLYRFYIPSSWIVCVPEGTDDALIPEVVGFQSAVDPWVRSLRVRVGAMGVRVVELAPRYPLAQWHEVCVTHDQEIVQGLCPYSVPMILKMSSEHDLSYVFGVMKRLHQLYGHELSKIVVADGGTVTIELPNYSIILGRRQMLERLSRAQQSLSQPSWQASAGRLDMRYADGFAWKKKEGEPEA